MEAKIAANKITDKNGLNIKYAKTKETPRARNKKYFERFVSFFIAWEADKLT